MVFSAPAMLDCLYITSFMNSPRLDDQPDPALFLKFGRVGNQSVTRSPHRRAQTRRRSDTANYVKLRRAAQTPAYAPAPKS